MAKIPLRRERLTNTAVSGHTCAPGINCSENAKFALLFDAVSPRLAVRATLSGSKSFVFDGYLGGRSVNITIGNVGNWGIDDARSRARELQTLIDKGIDPREQERERKAAAEDKRKARETALRAEEKRKRFTLKALCLEYVEYLKSRGKGKSARDALSAFRVHVFESVYANNPASDIKPTEVAELVRAVYEQGKHRTAGVLRAYLTAAYNAGRKAPTTATITSGLIPFGITHNPADVVENIKTPAGERHLSAEELKAYLACLDETPAGTALRLALLTGGQRMAQLLRATVGDYIKETGTLRLFDGKGKRKHPREHLIPVAAEGRKLLDALTDGKPAEAFILRISPRTAGNRLSEICKEIKVSTFDLRDIRRTVETMLVGLGISKSTRAQLLSHGLGGVQDVHYDKYAYIDEKRSALEAWESRLNEIETGKPSGRSNVHPLKRA